MSLTRQIPGSRVLVRISLQVSSGNLWGACCFEYLSAHSCYSSILRGEKWVPTSPSQSWLTSLSLGCWKWDSRILFSQAIVKVLFYPADR